MTDYTVDTWWYGPDGLRLYPRGKNVAGAKIFRVRNLDSADDALHGRDFRKKEDARAAIIKVGGRYVAEAE